MTNSLLARYLWPQRGAVISLGLLLLTSIGLQLINPQIVRYFIDSVTLPGSGSAAVDGLNRLFVAAGLFMAVALLRQVVNLVATYVGENVAWLATNNLRADLALHCLKLDMGFHKSHTPGELIERVDGDVNQLANFFSQLVIRLGSNVVLIGGVLALLWWENWRIGLAMTAVMLLGAFVLRLLHRHSVPRWQKVRQTDADLFGFIEEQLTGAEEIQTSAAQPFVLRRLLELVRQRWLAMRAAMRINASVSAFPFLVFMLAYIAAHVLGTTLFADNSLTIGGIYLLFHYIDLMREPLWESARQVEDLQRATASINRIGALQAIRPSLHDGPGTGKLSGPLGVAFTNLSFHYEDDPETPILDQIGFTLQPGSVLGLLGRTGSGKSTLARLLFRFYDPTAGEIALLTTDGRRHLLPQARLNDLRRQIGLVTQEVQLFRASVRHNLTLFDDSISDLVIRQVLADLGLAEWLARLPEGLDSRLEAGGGGLSAGQAQLLAFARVFLVNPGLVILDEASSRLDPLTEQLIERAIDRLLSGRTAIIIAHQLTTVQRAEEIMILEKGRVVEHGRRQTLAADPNSRFAHLLQTGLEEALA
jgi:ATP-binding cassette, subfamily B, bacterial